MTTTDSQIQQVPSPVLSDGDHERFAHIVSKADQMKGYVFGQSITALCGKTWVPTRDPERFPLCPDCAARRDELRAASSN